MNKAIIMGNIGGEPQLRTVGNTSVLSFSIATSEKYKDRDGELIEKTQWHNIQMWGKDKLAEHLRKGMKVLVHGQIEYREYTTDQGEVKKATDIKCWDLEFCEPKRSHDDEPM